MRQKIYSECASDKIGFELVADTSGVHYATETGNSDSLDYCTHAPHPEMARNSEPDEPCNENRG